MLLRTMVEHLKFYNTNIKQKKKHSMKIWKKSIKTYKKNLQKNYMLMFALIRMRYLFLCMDFTFHLKEVFIKVFTYYSSL